MNKHHTNRRRFLKFASYGLVAIGASSLGMRQTRANELSQLDLEDPTAKALGYVHKSPDASKLCSNCLHIKGANGEQWRPCALFPGRLVNNDGWCKGWAAQPQ